uniref:Riboflavin biosynthesis protein PYRD, chloroplastic n=1 Tax=Zea mays TaxID=4577 RepID=A0A804LCD3_MAIZE
MASSLVSRPHLTQRPVRAATLASATRPRLVAGALGGRCQAQAAGDLDDAHYMRRCVELARKAAGHTSPNPMVGCVIVRDGRVVGEGFHPKAGQPHAEVFALRDAGNLAENATAYVSLEPCNHYGRTPPCTEALINAKVKEVVVGMTDPNPIVASKGIEKLQGAGISVRVGVEEALCRKLNEAYIHRMLTGKAFATLRATLSMNGIITNQIGKGADQSAQGESSRLHIPSLSQEHASRAIVLADSPVTVEPAGVEVAVFRQIDLESILQLLAQRGLCSVLVDFREAGESFASLLNDFQEDKLVQKVVVEVLPFWLASDGLSNLAFGGSQSFPLKNLELRDVNGSVLLEGYV